MDSNFSGAFWMGRAVVPAVVAVALATAMAYPLSAQDTERVTVGTLTCKSDAAKQVTEPVLRNISCDYDPIGSGQPATFSGDIIHKGPDNPAAQMSSAEILVWNVWVPKGSSEDPALIGKYYGVREDDPAQPGLGANILVGGDGNGILLEPVVNPEVGDGPGDTRTVIELELRAART